MLGVDLTLFWNHQAPGAPAVAPQAAVETRTWALMVEFPELDDEQVALLVRDEIINAMGNRPEFLEWAHASTVGRLRRTAVLAHIREERALRAASSGPDLGPNGERTCRDCRKLSPWWAPGCQSCNGAFYGDEGGVVIRTCKACSRRVRKAPSCGGCGAGFE